jgi:hypothetical protein
MDGAWGLTSGDCWWNAGRRQCSLTLPFFRSTLKFLSRNRDANEFIVIIFENIVFNLFMNGAVNNQLSLRAPNITIIC